MTKLHSIETMGLLDGPGIRTIFFLSGCPLRCLFCHNPDTQDINFGKDIEVDEIVKRARRMKPYFKNNGGVTISGGEPLIHGKFLVELLEKLKEENIHTAIDTSGIGDRKYYKKILELVDLILLDIKHYDSDKFFEITGKNQKYLIEFMNEVKKSNVNIWIRHVMMPGYTDSEEDMDKIIDFIDDIKMQVEKIDILPYHTLGVNKYKLLNIKYPLESMPPMDRTKARSLEVYVNDVLKSRKKEL